VTRTNAAGAPVLANALVDATFADVARARAGVRRGVAVSMAVHGTILAGLVVFAGEGFSPNMRSYLFSTGKAVELEDLSPWLQLYFGI